MYQQFEIVWVRYPFSDQPERGKTRPALVVSNEESNALDSDVLVCPITSTLRGDAFAVRLTNEMLTSATPRQRGTLQQGHDGTGFVDFRPYFCITYLPSIGHLRANYRGIGAG